MEGEPKPREDDLDEDRLSEQEITNQKGMTGLGHLRFVLGLWKFLNSNIVVACCSTLVFGVILAYCGAKFQNDFWLQQANLSRFYTKLSKVEDEQVNLITNIYTILGRFEQELWNLFSATHGFREGKKAKDRESQMKDIDRIESSRNALQTLKTELDSVVVKVRVYFPEKAGEVLINELYRYHSRVHMIVLQEADWTQLGSTLEKFNEMMNELRTIGYSIQQRVGRAIIPAQQ